MKKTNPSIPTPLPRILQFEKMAYGLFLHWGLYSQLGRGEWVMYLEKIPARKYNALGKTFTARWLDNNEELAWTQNLAKGIFALDATAYPVGGNFVSWNFKHLANYQRESSFNRINSMYSYTTVRIISPPELVYGDDNQNL